MGLAIRLGWIYGASMNDTKNIQAMPIDGDDAGSITMDLTGLKCPLPVLKARRQIGQMPAGGILVVIANDPAAPLDFDHFCQTGGHDLLESVAKDGVFTMRIAKALN
jgi:tRNA 2-thiouridine synthesizing protein A